MRMLRPASPWRDVGRPAVKEESYKLFFKMAAFTWGWMAALAVTRLL